MKNNSFKEIWDKLKSCKKILMTLHLGPDGDSLGSCAAMKYVLEKEGIEVKLVSKDPLPGNLKKMEFAHEVNEGKGFWEYNLDDYDAIVLLDAGSPQLINLDFGERYIFNGNHFYINIDHHKTNNYFGTLNYVEILPSTCSLLINFFKEVGIEIDKEIARRLLLGVSTDSSFFTVGDSLKSMKDAIFLIEKGVNYKKEIVKPVLYSNTLNSKKFQSELYKNLIFVKDKRLAYTLISFNKMEQYGLTKSEMKLGAYYIKDLDGVDIVFTLIEFEGYIKGSLRSTVDEIDVSLIAQKLGGGGHKGAAGFSLKEISLKEAEEKTLKVVEDYLDSKR